MTLNLKLVFYTKSLLKLILKKEVQELLIVARSSYKQFDAYYKWFEHKNIDANYVYGQI